ncbi:tRNA-dihydrouridine synthase [Thalassoglobus sp. JC818]|uniref:tRNA dihydrouridine synthase n=1 Tax=Thalassoglobus sp. JC818 TaxID=3232136 RepID=UPI003459707A
MSLAAPSEIDESPIDIGNRRIPSRYFLAPLAGYTHLAFRRVIREIGGLGLATTDLVLASQLVAKSRKSQQLVATCESDQPLSVQIFSGITAELVKAAKWLEDRGYQGIDINMGCPMAKINSSGGGARLMCDVDGACTAVSQVVEAVSVPVTVKMRLGWDRDHLTAPALAREFEQCGVTAITIHGRTRQQGFHGNVDLDGIRKTVEAVQSIPIVGNGDVRSPEDAIAMRQRTGCAAVAIGRGAILDPWIFRKLADKAQGLEPFEPSRNDQIEFLKRHFALMCEQHEDYSCILFRKFVGWYGQRLGIPDDLEDRLRRFESIDEFNEIVEQVAERHGERVATVPTALLKVPNGPVERW